MHLSDSSAVHVSRSDHASVFHTTSRCRYCPSGSRTVSRAAAVEAELTECEACYEDRVGQTDVPFTLVSAPQEPMPLPARRSHPPSTADD
jgi:hypothetical protein